MKIPVLYDPEKPTQTLVLSSKLPMAIDEREKNYSRSCIPGRRVFSRNYPFTLFTVQKEKKTNVVFKSI